MSNPHAPGLHESLVTSAIYPLNFLRKGIRPSTLRSFCARDNWSREQIQNLQAEKLREFLVYARDNTAFYERAMRERGVDLSSPDIFEEVRKLPVLKKEDIRRNKQDLLAEPFRNKKGLVEKVTGGSTGVPLAVLSDREDYRLNGLAIARQRRWIGWHGGMRTISLFGGFRDISGRLERSLRKLLVNDKVINILDRSNADYAGLAETLRLYRPKAVIGYFSILREVAAALGTDRKIPGLRLVIACAEPLDEAARSYVERRLGAPVYFQYGSRELGTFAQECREKAGYHYAQDVAFCEILDDENKCVSRGNLTVTWFANRVMPLIRYSTGDAATLDDSPCACGLPYQRLGAIEGRLSSMIHTSGGARVSALILPHLLKDFPWVREFQGEQENSGGIVIRARVDHSLFSEKSLAEATRKLRGLLGTEMKIDWILDEPFIAVPTGKHVMFISRINRQVRTEEQGDQKTGPPFAGK